MNRTTTSMSVITVAAALAVLVLMPTSVAEATAQGGADTHHMPMIRGGMMGQGMGGMGMMGGGMGSCPGMMGGGMMGQGMGGMGMGGMGMMGGGAGMGGGMMGQGMGGGMMGQGMGGGMMGMGPMAMVTLGDDQRAKLNKIQDGLRKQHWETMGKMMDEQAKLRDLYETDTPDAKKIGATYERIHALQRQNIEASIDARNKMHAVLTKEQQEQLQQMRRGGMPMGGPGMMGPHGQMGPGMRMQVP